ncbi:MAG: hypothetical protein ACKVOS_09605 [Sphingorhabdus sp.]|uniref:hypothetical protein n=1 Tax=Sphingorhabdus sp. TaxID=1902408 RepID=UPI0038FCA1AD
MQWPSLKEVSDTTRQVATKSAMNPMLWICGLTTPFSIVAAAYSAEPISYLFFGMACLPIFYGIRAYEFWMKSDPDRLQSERYLIERQIVGRIGEKSESGSYEIEIPSRPVLIDNPQSSTGDAA